MSKISAWPGDFGAPNSKLPGSSHHASSLRANLEAILAMDGASATAPARAGPPGNGRMKFAAGALAALGVAALAVAIGLQFRTFPTPMQHWTPERAAAIPRARPALRGGSIAAAVSDPGRAEPGQGSSAPVRQEAAADAPVRRDESSDGQAPTAPAPSAGGSRKPAGVATAERDAPAPAPVPAIFYRRLPTAHADGAIAPPSSGAAADLAANDVNVPPTRISLSTTGPKPADDAMRAPDAGSRSATADRYRREALDLIRSLRRQ